MRFKWLICFVFWISVVSMSYGQTDTKAWLFSGIVYDNNFNPLPYTHVIAKGTGKGDITDINGVFSLYVSVYTG